MVKRRKKPVDGMFDAMGTRIGDVVRKHRTRQQLTLRQVSEVSGVCISTIYLTEIGRPGRAITVERLCRLSAGLGKEFLWEVIGLIHDFTKF